MGCVALAVGLRNPIGPCVPILRTYRQVQIQGLNEGDKVLVVQVTPTRRVVVVVEDSGVYGVELEHGSTVRVEQEGSSEVSAWLD